MMDNYETKKELEQRINKLLDEYFKETSEIVYNVYVSPPNMYVPLLREDGKIVPNDSHSIQLWTRAYEFDYTKREYDQ